MAETANIGDMFQVTVEGLLEGQHTANVLNFTARAQDTDVELHLILALITCFVTHLIPVLPSGMQLTRVRWKRTSPTLGPEFITTTNLPQAGGGSEDALPSYCSALISIHTALGGRSHRGRMYIAGIPEDATANSFLSLDQPYWAAIAAFIVCVAGKFIAPIPQGGSNFLLGVYSRKIGGSSFPYGVGGFTPATSLERVQLIATTRSRKVGRGN